MNRRQKLIIKDSVVIICFTVAAVVAMINFKDWTNRSEAMRAMQQLGQIAVRYKKQYGSVPPKSYVDDIRESLEGNARLVNLQYRARWIDFDADPDRILAYAGKNYHSWFIGSEVIVLRLNGRVEWMTTKDFEKLLGEQQSQMEKEMSHNQ